jgi:hypothetical protein
MEPIHCEVCGESVGVYEPSRAIRADGTEFIGPRELLRSELGFPGAVAVHERCYRGPEPVRHTE